MAPLCGASNKKCLNVEETRDLTKKAVNNRFYNLLLEIYQTLLVGGGYEGSSRNITKSRKVVVVVVVVGYEYMNSNTC